MCIKLILVVQPSKFRTKFYRLRLSHKCCAIMGSYGILGRQQFLARTVTLEFINEKRMQNGTQVNAINPSNDEWNSDLTAIRGLTTNEEGFGVSVFALLAFGLDVCFMFKYLSRGYGSGAIAMRVGSWVRDPILVLGVFNFHWVSLNWVSGLI